MTTLINIGGTTVSPDELTLPMLNGKVDRRFRDHWQLEGQVVTVDVAKAAADQRVRISQEAERRRDAILSKNQQMELMVKSTLLNSVPEADRDDAYVGKVNQMKAVWGQFEAINAKAKALEELPDEALLNLDETSDEHWTD